MVMPYSALFEAFVMAGTRKSAPQTTALTDETLREMLKAAKGFRREHPGCPWVFMPETNLFAVIREFATATRAEERRRCLAACRGATSASDARSRIRALADEPPIPTKKGRQTR
jgi:hypothetical protein